ncbi:MULTISPECIES: Rqc2 family fibronectin-binding protein [Caproicibacterium]|uniref:Rqc2 homolog RqcH n=1 Tax=Caproicibacterium argilliputei TaxID=3030016 RepID=A0AA97DC62_9FIRM|nr:NFACT RNA binding domain-containing protein [Caproicibacterium argilliputei]WOC33612.1 NFACT RNA binding domain-containing protein [Caproicibacterium argilliputei]
MALDGAFLRHIKKEIESTALGTKVDKVYQPNRDELFLFLRGRNGTYKLLLSARANSARIHFVEGTPENPKYPPMLCMLLRKRLSGARLVQIRQLGLERALLLDFDGTNELGDTVRLTLAVEIMGRYSNVIFVDGDGKIIDALKRVDAEMSSERLVLPGLTYHLPPPQEKLCLLDAEPEQILARIRSLPADMELQKALLRTLQGVSPVVCRELQFQIGGEQSVTIHDLSAEQQKACVAALTKLRKIILEISGQPVIVMGPEKPFDFSFLPIRQYGSAAKGNVKPTFSALLDSFYGDRDRIERMHVKSQDLLRILATASERLSRKINHQRAELQQCEKRDEMRTRGDLLNANLYRIPKGSASVSVENFYEPNQPPLNIQLDPSLSPSQNAQKYYKAYRKASTAQKMLTVQIAQAKEELAYLDSVQEELSRAELERDLNEIRAELTEQGYIRRKKGKHGKEQLMQPLHFQTSDGFTVLVGRNNRQNDQLTLKQAHKNDVWFHTQKIPGSHVILVTQGREPTEIALAEAAGLAAFHSRGKDSAQVPVDYTLVRYVSKPQGAKPGMVIYVRQKTLYVTPDAEFVKSRMERS